MIMIAGPIHQFSFWLLLAYYRGDVYGKEPAGVMNTIHTVLVGCFNLDLLIKTWLLAWNPKNYLDYVKPPALVGAAVVDTEGCVKIFVPHIRPIKYTGPNANKCLFVLR